MPIDVLFDACVVETDVLSYCGCSPQALFSTEVEKKHKYMEAFLAC